jgi:hypothetical protein
MKHVVSLALVLIFTNAYSQLIDDLPTDDKGNLNFNEVVQVDSASKSQLHFRAKQFFADAFKSAQDVIQMDDKEAGIVIGKGWSMIYIRVMGNPVPSKMWYTVKVQSREGRYKVELYDISYEGDTGPAGYPEQMFDKKNYYKSNGKPRDINEKYKNETIAVVNGMLDMLQAQMKKRDVMGKDDW